MRIPFARRARRLARRLGGQHGKRPVILLYHRVADVRPDPWALCVSPQQFGEQLDMLRQHFQPIALQQLAEGLRAGRLPRRAVAITFDDGYYDNLYNAKPLLERYDVPATIFLTTGNIGRGREFWWDELERLLLQPGRLPAELRLNIGGQIYNWELGDAQYYSEAAFQEHAGWAAWEEDKPTMRHELYQSLWRLLHPLADSERQDVLDAIADWAQVGVAGRPSHRSLEAHEMVKLGRGSIIEVGAHTVTHPALSMLTVDRQHEEITRSKTRLEEILGRPMLSFSYPYGRRSDYSDATVRIVRDAGFTCACSNFAGTVGRSEDPHQLPRVNVPNCDGGELQRQLESWFNS